MKKLENFMKNIHRKIKLRMNISNLTISQQYFISEIYPNLR